MLAAAGHDGPRGLLLGLLIATLVCWMVIEVRQSLNHRSDAAVADAGSRPVIRVATIVGVVGAILAVKHLPGADIGVPTVAAWIGLVVLWCGVGLRWWSFHTLGRYFTFRVQTSADQPVITGGPYRFVRHPSYSAILLAVAGIGLLIGNWVALAALLVAVGAAVVYRIHIEERALLAAIGDPYRAFAATRKRLVPGVW